jgi:integrase
VRAAYAVTSRRPFRVGYLWWSTSTALLGLRIFEACDAGINDLGEEHGHRVLRVRGKGGKVVLVPLPQRRPARSTAPSTGVRRGPSCATCPALGWTAMPPPAGSNTWPPTLPACHGCTRTCCDTFVTTLLYAGVSLRDVQIAAQHPDPRTTMRYDRARMNRDRHANDILAAYMPSGT